MAIFQKSTVYSVKYNRSSDKWTIYVDGSAVVKNENPGALTGRYNYHEYDTKSKAVTKARQIAKRHAKRDVNDYPVELKIFNKSGSKITDKRTYNK